ncbi:DMT family transporter [Thiomonas sp.]|uniref:DMT family transporter n=1 Tax=Thiomonas sp. TaxID=2047785 RepID=UPI0026372AF1|nr:DMT family transporter [Thiomonas sp.]
MDIVADLQRVAARTHRRAVAAMVLCTLLWSIAGVITRHLHGHDGSALVFWRSGFAALTLLLVLGARLGPVTLARQSLAPAGGGAALLWLSGFCWAVMYTAFMIALSLTTVAQTLVAVSLGPLFAALMGLLFLGTPVRARTWGAIVTAMLGMAWMFWNNLHASAGPREVAGLLIGLLVPVAAAANWVALRHAGARLPMQLAPMLGAGLSAASMGLFAGGHLAVDGHDLGWLAVLGVFQLALPGAFAVWAAQRLAPAEVALLGLLEVIFGTLWAWLGASEVPSASTLLGGGLILAALVGNELLSMLAFTRPR